MAGIASLIRSHYPNLSAIEVNFQETLITLNVDLTDGFSLGDKVVKLIEETGDTDDHPWSEQEPKDDPPTVDIIEQNEDELI